MKFIDAAPIAGTRRTADGYLVAEVRTARTGIQDYAGHEVGKPEMAVVRVYRPEDQVFAKDSLGSYAHRPVTNDHPDESVTADNWRDVAVGQIGDEVARDGDYVRVPLIVMDAAAIKAVEDGKRELSAGYTCDLAFESGVTPDGQPYDAIQKSIRINHVAIVQNGRAGYKARIGDGAVSWGASPRHLTDQSLEREKIMTLKTVTVDGIPVEVTDQGATVIATLQTRLADADKKLSDAAAAHSTAIAAKDEEIGKLKADLKTAQDAAEIDVDKLVADRAALVASVTAIDAKIEVAGKSDADLRRAAVASRLGDEMVKDASDAEIVGMFKAVASDSRNSSDPVRDAVANLKPVVGDARAMADKAWQDSVHDMNAWRNQKGA